MNARRVVVLGFVGMGLLGGCVAADDADGAAYEDAAYETEEQEAGLAGATLWVDDDGAQAQAAGISSYHKSITAAITAAQPGDTIKVLPGIYKGALMINKKNITLQAMKNKTTPVNAALSPDNTDWPVVVEPGSGESGSNVITVNGKGDGATIRGFHVRKAGFNGIHLRMSGSQNAFDDLCEDIRVEGNKIENVAEDGIKVNQCNRILLRGNHIVGFSLNPPIDPVEHGIDFVAVSNSIIRDNKITNTGWVLAGIGMTVKGASINVVVEDNEIGGNLKGAPITAGEGSSPTSGWHFRSGQTASPPYIAQDVCIRDNALLGNNSRDLTMVGCKDCDVMNNTLGKKSIRVSHDDPFKSKNVCLQGNGQTSLLNEVGAELSTSGCSCQWTPAIAVKTSQYGWDMQPGNTSGPIPDDPTQNASSEPPPPASSGVYVEAESGSGKYAVFSAVSSSGASGGKYVSADAANYDAAAGDSSSAETLSYSPQVSTSGVHHYWARVQATESLHNSLFISVKGSAFVAQDLGTGSGFRWVKLKGLDSVQLQPGTVSVKIKNRESGAYIDRLFITSDASQTP